LELDRANALWLKEQFACEEAKLRAEYPAPTPLDAASHSRDTFNTFVDALNASPVQAPWCYKGPLVVKYELVTLWDYEHTHRTPQEQCARDRNAVKALDQALKGSEKCPGMGEAIKAHEDYHQRQCEALGGQSAYYKMSGADRAHEEVVAYDVQIKMLDKAINDARKNFDGMHCILKEAGHSQQCAAARPPLPRGPCSPPGLPAH
jgi:hypothetical protein